MSTFTPDRLIATVAALAAFAGVIAGVLAMTRPSTRRPMIALVTGLTGLVVGTVVVVTADGGPGTGNGIVGGWAAVVLGLAATVLGGLAMSRRRGVIRG
jgi:peptidoglycan/LPS O-acetylase OafA/YrhL